MKVLLILVDGMRPDCITDISQAERLRKKSRYYAQAQTVFPPVTLPCHVSLFHSVDPLRHGTTTNDYAPQVRPIRGLCEVLKAAGKTCDIYYSWEQIRDISRPGSLRNATFRSGTTTARYLAVTEELTESALAQMKNDPADFTFFYIATPDAAGHQYGWCSPEYQKSLSHSWEQIERLLAVVDDEYTVIVTADHGGHDRMHGQDVPEDMTIPLFLYGQNIPPQAAQGANIKDIAPTVVRLFGLEADEEWEGRALI
jgi:predicted AlkP superfamily pyrophosphatase or phosphodiesterase